MLWVGYFGRNRAHFVGASAPALRIFNQLAKPVAARVAPNGIRWHAASS
jgi:hypothetical protein